ncbi:class II histone deacetylase [Natronorubrum sp. A-ect3]|uniref:class II histone deacetylase n=1 Tax=Natronorubrum sp. A-ect3 TaxID=3242698 RepID=UPI00359D4340
MQPELTVYWDEKMLDHRAPQGAFKLPSTPIIEVNEEHPDQPSRVQNILAMIQHSFDDRTTIVSPDPAEKSDLELVHESEYIEWVKEFSRNGGGRIGTTTTGMNEHTFDSASVAAGAAISAGANVIGSDSNYQYALCRPSGHHAQSDCADGFCFFNNVALAAEKAILDGAEKVAIIDWDVHHGNGTQEIFYDRDDVLFISIHHDHGSWDSENHPQEGSLEENGKDEGEGYNINIPLSPGIGDSAYVKIFRELVRPIIKEYLPDAIIVSAGQDASIVDPNARNLVTRDGFRKLGKITDEIADEFASGNLALVQEGGYQPSHLSFATLGVFEGLFDVEIDLEHYGTEDPFDWVEPSSAVVDEELPEIKDTHSAFWPV